MNSLRNKFILGVATLVFLVPASASAQAMIEPLQPNSNENTNEQATGDIVVTAQRRSERLQDIPMSISAFDGAALQRSPITNLADIQTSIPNVNISPRNSSGVVSIRGIGFDIVTAGAEGSVAIHSDGVYQSRPLGALSGLFDIERIEVARGPQGTLYGRNATGGAINIISRKPTQDVTGYIDLSYGNYNSLAIEGAVSGPLAGDKLLARVSAKIEQRDGWGTNIANDSRIDDLKSRAVRGMLEFRPSDAVNFLLEGDYFKRDDNAYAVHFAGCVIGVCGPNAGTSRGYAVPTDPRDVSNDTQPINRPESYGVSLTTKIDLPFADLSAITAYRKGNSYYQFDFDGTAQPGAFLTREENYKTFSQEIQVSGNTGNMDWVGGVYYFHERNFARANGHFPPFITTLSRYFQGGVLTTDAYAVFGEASYHLTSDLTATLGARYSKERKHIDDEYTFTNGPVNMVGRQGSPSSDVPCVTCLGLPDRAKFSSFTPKFGLRYQFAPNKLIYVTAQKGFKSGGFAVGAVTPAFDPETIWSYEFGLKANWFGRALTTNISAYHYDYSNLQVGQVQGVATIVRNAGSAKVDGVEAEVRLTVSPRVSFDGFTAYNHARFTQYTSANPAINPALPLDLRGNLLSNAPKWTGKIGGEYRLPVPNGDLTIRGDIFTSSRVYFSPFNNNVNSQKPYSLLNASVRYDADSDWYVSAFINNIADTDVKAGSIVTSGTTGAFIIAQYLPPRTYGFKVGKKF